MNSLAVLISLTLFSCCATEWLDMSYSYDSKTNYWPGHTILKQIPVQNKLAPARFSSYDILMSEHGGTHTEMPLNISTKKGNI